MNGIALFDLDSTLFDRTAAFRRWAQWFVEANGMETAEVDWLVTIDDDGNATRSDFFEQIKHRFALTQSVESLTADYQGHYPRFFEADQVVCAALSRLRGQGWRVAIVTNGPPTQRAKVEKAVLTELVDACCVSGELGFWKPDRRIFEHAISLCGDDGVGAPGEGGIWMIGDSPDADMAGAHALGIRTVWMHRGRQWESDSFRPDHRAATIPEAVDIVLAASDG